MTNMSLHAKDNQYFDVIVVGGGIVGLATALNIMQSKPETKLILIEKESRLAYHQTGHNSGVIHSGLYYKPGSLKAINCKRGYDLLIDFCIKHSIPHEICGKIVVATCTKELPQLDELYRRGIANGLDNLRFLNSSEIKSIEPHCSGIKGLFVPQTGIVDYVSVANKFAEILLSMGVEIALNERVVSVKQHDGVYIQGLTRSWRADAAVVCAGLQSDRLAKDSIANDSIKIIPFRGEYYRFTAKAPKLVNHLIYPVPDPAFPFLGVHFTRMLNGDIECGPNAVFAFGREAYKRTDFNLLDLFETLMWKGFRLIAKKYWRVALNEYYQSFSKKAFVRALKKLVPSVDESYLEPAGAGVRAQACDKNGNLLDDFEIIQDGSITHVLNAPSPAATSSLAIGETIACKILELTKFNRILNNDKK